MIERNTASPLAPRPSAAAWVFALLSLLGTTTLAVALVYLGALLRYEIGYQQLQENIARRDLSEADSSISSLLTPPRFFRLPFYEHLSDSAENMLRKRTISTELLAGLSLIDARKFDLAEKKLEGLDSLTGTSSFAPIRDRLQELFAASARLRALEQQGELLEQEREALLDEADLIASGFGELFGLEPADVEDKQMPPSYQQGILQDLPVLVGIPDALMTMDDLRSAVEKAAAKVSVSGNDSHETFQQRLDDIRAANKGALERFTQLAERSTELRNLQTRELVNMKPVQNKTTWSIKRFLLELLAPKYQPLHRAESELQQLLNQSRLLAQQYGLFQEP